jgi:hypothetical protein
MNEHLAKLSREAERMVPQWKLMGPTAGDYPIAMMRQADEFAMATVRAEVSNYMPTQVLNRLNQAYSDNDDAAIRVLEADLWLRGAVSYQKPTLADVKAMTRMLETVRSARAARRAQVPAISALADAINKLPGQKAAERQVIQITAARRIA